MTSVLTFDDEFNTLSLWNGTSGTWDTTAPYVPLNGSGYSLPSNGEQEWYINSNYAPTSSVKPWTVNNGILTLTAAPASAAIQSLIGGYQYTSGVINTSHSFSQTYGYFEMRAELPAGQGLWPAFWLLPESGAWPPEIDAMEVLGNSPTTLYTSVHSSDAAGNEVNGGGPTTVANTSTGFHTYGVDWEPDYITYYFDGTPIMKVATPSDMNQPMYMIANLAVGGYWPGDANSTTPFPAQMEIDYIRAYSSLPTSVIAAEAGASTSVSVTTATYTAPANVTTILLAGSSAQNVTGNNAGDTITSNDYGSTIHGGTGNDTIIAGHGADILTGGGGSDTFVFNYLPWNAGQITDFNTATDKLDLSGIFSAIGYTGSNPVADGYLSFVSDGAGDTWIYINPHTTSGAAKTLITTLDGVAPSSITGQDYGYGSAGSTGSTGSSTGSGTGSSSGSGTTVDTAAATYTAASGVTTIVLTGTAAQTVHANALGDTITSNDYGSTIIGGNGNDTLIAGHGADMLTGGGGSDTFVFNYLPWNAGQIIDFNTATDKLDLSGIFSAIGYTGSNPVADGYLSFVNDGSGDTQVYVNSHQSSNPWPTLITTLDHVSASSITANDYSFSASSGSGSTGSTGGSDPVYTAARVYMVADGVTDVVLTGTAAQTVRANSLGDTITSNDYGSTIVGGSGNDTLIAGHGADVLSGRGGDDTFVFNVLPWSAGEITDFNVRQDKIDLSGLFSSIGYTGTNPIADGYLSLVSDGAGDTKVYVNAHNVPTLVTTLDHVSPASVTAHDWIFHTA